MATQDGERFDLGRVAARTFGVVGRHPFLFVGVALLFSGLPTLALRLFGGKSFDFAAVGQLMGDGYFASIVPVGLGGLFFFVFSSLMQASLVVATLQDLSGRRVEYGACVGRSLRLLLPLIGLSIATGVGLVFGFVMFVVPAFVLYVMWFVAVPVLVEERSGVFAALGRSAALTAGARWSIFGLVIAFLVGSGLIALAQRLLELLTTSDSLDAVIDAFTTMLSSLIASTGVAATYVELRTVKEGANVDALEAVFA